MSRRGSADKLRVGLARQEYVNGVTQRVLLGSSMCNKLSNIMGEGLYLYEKDLVILNVYKLFGVGRIERKLEMRLVTKVP